MAIIKSVPLFFTKLDPKRPIVINEKDDGEKTTGWELTARTEDKAQAAAWKKLVGAKQVKAIREDKEDEESPIMYWQMRLRKKEFNAKGEESEPVEVVRADTLEDLDPKIIGNGSVADLRVFQYDYSFKQNGQLIEGTATIVMGVKVKKLVKYVPQAREEFEKDEFEVVDADGESTQSEDDGSFVSDDDEDTTPKKKGRGRPAKRSTIDDDEIPF